jgi:uncharacterized protein (TIGR00290 family)
MRKKVLLSWSGGKDSSLALDRLRKSDNFEVAGLLTTVTEPYKRVSMHGVRQVLLTQQAKEIGLPLSKVIIVENTTEEEYRDQMRRAMLEAKNDGIDGVAFGDIALEDVKRYREENLAEVDMKAFFPIWGRDTHEMASIFIKQGFKAIVTCIDSRCLKKDFVGRIVDEQFLKELPNDVDPSGENGEFHTFVFEGPIFHRAVPIRRRGIEQRDPFYFCDLI